MNEQIKCANNVFDLFALFSSYILEHFEKNHYEFYDFNDDNYNEVHDAVEKYIDDVKNRGHKQAVNSLKKVFIRFFADEFSIEKCYAVVRYMDEQLEYKPCEKLLEYKDFINYSTISEKYGDKVRIIPKIKNTLLLSDGEIFLQDPLDSERKLFRRPEDCCCSVLDKMMVNYIIWDKDKLERFPMSIYRTNVNGVLGRHFAKRRQLTIGVVPLTCMEIDDILDIAYTHGTFYINGMKEDAEQMLQQRYIDIYRRSRSKGIDFLIFPEMLMTSDIMQQIKNEAEKKDGPKFIVNGSIWESGANRSILTDGEGNEIFTYYKKNPFILKKDGKEYKERLQECSDSRNYSVLEIEGIGRVGICICKDLMHEDILMFHKYLRTDLLLVPAFSDSLKMKTDAWSLAEKYNCFTILANSCAAYKKHWKDDKQKDIGFLTVPAKEKTSNDCYILTYGADGCVGQCDDGCIGKLFTLSFTDILPYGKKFSIKIDETIF